MYDILSTVSPWVVILILAAVIALLLAMVCWCLHLSRRKEEDEVPGSKFKLWKGRRKNGKKTDE